MLPFVKEILVLLFVPILLFLAWRAWDTRVRLSMPCWRKGLAWTALLIIFLIWITACLLDIPELIRHNLSLAADLKGMIYLLSKPLNLTALLLALSLKGASRLEAIVAALLLLVCWPGGYR